MICRSCVEERKWKELKKKNTWNPPTLSWRLCKVAVYDVEFDLTWWKDDIFTALSRKKEESCGRRIDAEMYVLVTIS